MSHNSDQLVVRFVPRWWALPLLFPIFAAVVLQAALIVLAVVAAFLGSAGHGKANLDLDLSTGAPAPRLVAWILFKPVISGPGEPGFLRMGDKA